MKKVIIASKNPVKVQAAMEGFQKVFQTEKFGFESVSVPTDIPEQPMSDAETLRGALSRMRNAQAQYPQADYWVGIEGGIEKVADGLQTFSWAVVQAKHTTVIGKAKSVTYYLPPKVAELIEAGKSLGEADDIVFQKQSSNTREGSIGLLTNGLIGRAQRDSDTVILALSPFLLPTLFEVHNKMGTSSQSS
jgi:inosine/xanthosine triphosphatase